MKTILAPLDFSPASEAVVNEAKALARDLKGKIVLLSVVQPPLITSDYAPIYENVSDLIAATKRMNSERLEAVRSQIAAESLPVEIQLADGPVVETIADAATGCKADYIVMGSHGHTAFYDLVVGSTTHGVLKRSGVPVVIVPPRKMPAPNRR